MRTRVLSWLVSIGLVVLVVHNPDQPLLKYAFLPAMGLAFVCMGVLLLVADNYRSMSLGPKKLYVPLLVISASIAASGFWQYATGNSGLTKALGIAAFGFVLFGLYAVSRSLGRGVLRAFPILVVVEAVSLVIAGVTHGGQRTGGIIGPLNYDIATGVLVLGVLLSPVRHQWWLSAVAVAGLLFAGAEEALVAVAILGVVWLLRRDFGKRMFLPLGVVAAVLVVLVASGAASDLYQPAKGKVQRLASIVSGAETTHPITNSEGSPVSYPREVMYNDRGQPYVLHYSAEWEETLDNALHYRWTQYRWAVQEVSPLGHGYEMLAFTFRFVHNVPLIIVDQVGPIAAVAWVFVTVLCLVRFRLKYLMVAVVALSLFDHYLWTQVAPYYWAVVGVASAATESDLVFRGADSA